MRWKQQHLCQRWGIVDEYFCSVVHIKYLSYCTEAALSLERRLQENFFERLFTFQASSQTNLHNSGISFTSSIKSTEYLAATFSMWKDVKGHSGLACDSESRLMVYTVLDEGIRKEVERRGDRENTCFWFSSAGEDWLIFFFAVIRHYGLFSLYLLSALQSAWLEVTVRRRKRGGRRDTLGGCLRNPLTSIQTGEIPKDNFKNCQLPSLPTWSEYKHWPKSTPVTLTQT